MVVFRAVPNGSMCCWVSMVFFAAAMQVPTLSSGNRQMVSDFRRIDQTAVPCRDGEGRPVDWWYLLKLPGGRQYVYQDALTVQTQKGGWSVNAHSNLSDSANPMFQSLKPLFSCLGNNRTCGSQQQTAHLLYNDETPGGEVSSYRAHAKGVVVFGRSLGFWLVHSVPKFPPDPASQPYGYPDPEAEYGQSAACVSLESKAIEGCVATCLLDMFVNGYSSALPAEWELEFPNMKAAMEGRHFSSNDTRSCSMTTGLGAKPLRAFSTSHGWGHMLFRDLVQPWYGVPMAHQSWRRGAGGPVPSCCYPSCNFDDINVVSLTAAGQTWKSMLDHGKWSVSVQQQPASSVLPDVACHSDLNHMYSQTYRGGGALCFELTGLWATLSKTISSVEPCIVSHQNAGGLGSDVASRDCA